MFIDEVTKSCSQTGSLREHGEDGSEISRTKSVLAPDAALEKVHQVLKIRIKGNQLEAFIVSGF
jgi:hypothetical protein